MVAAGAAVYVMLMFAVVRPLIAGLARRWEGREVTREAVAVLFIALLASAAATEAIGIHAIFGAFLLGAIVPHDSALAHAMVRQLRELVTVLLLPAFFAFAGMRTRIDLLAGADLWLTCGLIVAVATAGKFGGTFLAARFTGYRSREAAMLGTLMNTRGLMELIVLNIGLELGVISPTLFAMLVLMALATTMMTSPILAWLGRGQTGVRPGSGEGSGGSGGSAVPRFGARTLSGEPTEPTEPRNLGTSELSPRDQTTPKRDPAIRTAGRASDRSARRDTRG